METEGPSKVAASQAVTHTYTVKTRRRSENAHIRQVHDNVIMYTSTRLHTRLASNVRAQLRNANDNDVIDNDGVLWRVQKIHRKRC